MPPTRNDGKLTVAAQRNPVKKVFVTTKTFRFPTTTIPHSMNLSCGQCCRDIMDFGTAIDCRTGGNVYRTSLQDGKKKEVTEIECDTSDMRRTIARKRHHQSLATNELGESTSTKRHRVKQSMDFTSVLSAIIDSCVAHNGVSREDIPCMFTRELQHALAHKQLCNNFM